MQLYLWILIIILFESDFVASKAGSPPKAKIFHLKTTSKVTWHKALHECGIHGMSLASISSKDENDRLLKQIKESRSDGNFWIAGTILGSGQPKVWYWICHHAPMDFTDWSINEPNNMALDEKCIELREEVDFKWNDNNCDNLNFYVCQEKKAEAEQPRKKSPLGILG